LRVLTVPLEPAVLSAAAELDAYAQSQGFPEAELVPPPTGTQGSARWAEAGCMWALRRGLYSRRQRAQLLQRLRKGRAAPEWEIYEEGDLVVCLHRNFAHRAAVLGATAGAPA
jgi:hypothetical protein